MKLNVTPVLVIIMYAITLAASSPMSIMYSGTITTIVCITIVMILNVVIITLYHESERIEISISLEKILNEYQHLLIDSQHCIHGKTSGFNATVSPNQSSTESNGINSENNIYLTSGHSQVSIVHTFRQVYNMYWFYTCNMHEALPVNGLSFNIIILSLKVSIIKYQHSTGPLAAPSSVAPRWRWYHRIDGWRHHSWGLLWTRATTATTTTIRPTTTRTTVRWWTKGIIGQL